MTGKPSLTKVVLLAVGVLGLPMVASAQMAVEYYHLDAIGNVLVVTDNAGTVGEQHDYDVFGQEVNAQAGSQPKRFTGKERDQETGWDYFGARYYGSKIGRFTTIDPVYTWRENLLDPQRWNRYAYVRNNPLRYVDPDGRELRTAAQQTMNAIAGPAASRISINNGVLDVSGLTAADRSGNEGAALLFDLASSKRVYSYTEAATGGITNLDNNPDWRYGKGKGPGDLPPAGVDAAVTIDPSINYVDAATGRKPVAGAAVAFHELAEAYAKIDKNMPYVHRGGGAGAHEDARQRERTLIGQRPGFTVHPAGEAVKKKTP